MTQWLMYLIDFEHVEQSSDKINSVTCASCWDFYIRITQGNSLLCKQIMRTHAKVE